MITLADLFQLYYISIFYTLFLFYYISIFCTHEIMFLFYIIARSFCSVFFLSTHFLAQHFSQSLPLLFISIFPLARLACRIIFLYFIIFYFMLCYRWTFGIANCPMALLLNQIFCLHCLCFVTGGHSVQQTVHLPFCSIIAFSHFVSYMDLSIAGMLDLQFVFIFSKDYDILIITQI